MLPRSTRPCFQAAPALGLALSPGPACWQQGASGRAAPCAGSATPDTTSYLSPAGDHEGGWPLVSQRNAGASQRVNPSVCDLWTPGRDAQGDSCSGERPSWALGSGLVLTGSHEAAKQPAPASRPPGEKRSAPARLGPGTERGAARHPSPASTSGLRKQDVRTAPQEWELRRRGPGIPGGNSLHPHGVSENNQTQ